MPQTTGKGVPYSVGTDPVASIDTTMQSLAEWVDGRPGIENLTASQRNALTGAALWPNRIIWNTTDGRLERYNSGTNAWVPIFRTSIAMRITHNFTIQGDVRVDNAGRDYYIPPYYVAAPTGQTNTLRTVRHRLLLGGTAACALDRRTAGGVTTRLATFTATTTAATTTLTTPALLADQDALELVVTAVTGAPKHLTVAAFHDLEI